MNNRREIYDAAPTTGQAELCVHSNSHFQVYFDHLRHHLVSAAKQTDCQSKEVTTHVGKTNRRKRNQNEVLNE